jgi:alpha-beta hydrolase superfamily lysophospholipase
VCVHGLGGYSGLFRTFADRAEERSFSVVAVDLRGFGHWEGERGAVENLGVYLDDLRDVVAALRERSPGRGVVLLGESLGASLVAWYAAEFPDPSPHRPDGIILVNAVTDPAPPSQMTAARVVSGAIAFLFWPDRRVDIAMDPRELGREPAFVREMESGPWVTRSVTFRFLVQANEVVRETPRLLARTDVPVLMFRSGEDVFSDDAAARRMLAAAGSGDRTYVHVPGCRHNALNDVCGEQVSAAALEWAAARRSGFGLESRP